MDTQHSQPPNLATRLRLARVDERVASLLVAAVEEELGVAQVYDRDAAAGRRLSDLIETAARRTGPSAVNKFALEMMELMADAPDVRETVNRPQPAATKA
jgi:hypothetical protein